MNNDVTSYRMMEKLEKDFGPVFLSALKDPDTVEIILNSDGSLWQEKLGEPLKQIGTMDHYRADAIMRTLAAFHNTTISVEKPLIECELPLDGSRFAGQIPPIVPAPVFAVRKRASRVFTLDQYIKTDIITPAQEKVLRYAVLDHRNILVVGGAGSGKTTLANALIHEITEEFPHERIVIIEDTCEIQCAAKNYVQYHTSQEVSMTQLVRTTLRMRPDRILVGEVRGPEALDLLMSWNLGHAGGIATLHANDADSALARLSTLISMHPNAPRDLETLIGESVDLIAHIARTKTGRIVQEIIEVESFDRVTQRYKTK